MKFFLTSKRLLRSNTGVVPVSDKNACFASAPLPKPSRQFASDNRSNICPEAWNRLAEANHAGHDGSYGDDVWSKRAITLLREIFETDCDVYFVFSGTAANSLSLATLCRGYQSVICHELAHVRTDECGAPAFFSGGATLRPMSGSGGKISAANLAATLNQRPDLRFPEPRALTLTQATELGTVYNVSELSELCSAAKTGRMNTHIDGARFANAVASLAQSPAELTWKAGVDVLCFGATKIGISAGEAVVFFDRDLGAEFAYRCKQSGQLASKMRLLTSQWVGLLENHAWLKHAGHANEMAKMLEAGLSTLPGVRIVYPVEANAVFADLPEVPLARIRRAGWDLYNLSGAKGVRIMCSWDTTAADVDCLLADFRKAMAEADSIIAE